MPYGSAAPPALRRNRLALASMICGIVGIGLFFLCTGSILGGVPALIMGFRARRQIRQSGGMQSGSRMALAGIITGAVATAMTVVFWSFAFWGLAQD